MSKRRPDDSRNFIDLTGEVDNFHPAFKRPRTSQFSALHYAGTSYLAEQASSYDVHPSYYNTGIVEVYDNTGADGYSYPNGAQFLPSSLPNARHDAVIGHPRTHNVSGHDLAFGDDRMPLNIVRPYQRTPAPNATRGTPIPVQISCRAGGDIHTGSNTSLPVRNSGIGLSTYVQQQFNGPVITYNPYEAVSWRRDVRDNVFASQVTQQRNHRTVPRFSETTRQHPSSHETVPVNLQHQITSFRTNPSHSDYPILGQRYEIGANRYRQVTLPSPPKIRRLPSHFQALPKFLDMMCSMADHDSRRRVFHQVVAITNRNEMELRGLVAY